MLTIQIASDLHHELATSDSAMSRPIPLADDSVNVLVLAGDIHNQLRGIDLYADYPVPVVYVCGNHEFYDSEMQSLLPEMRRRTTGTSVRLLEKDEFVLGNVRFLGTALWTDYHLKTLHSTQKKSSMCNGNRVQDMCNRFSPDKLIRNRTKTAGRQLL